MREVSNQIAGRYIHFRSKRAQHACAKERVELFTENWFVYAGIQPGPSHRSQSHCFHAGHETANRPMPLNEVNDGSEEFIAGRLTPIDIRDLYRSLHDECPQSVVNVSLVTLYKVQQNMKRIIMGMSSVGDRGLRHEQRG